MSEDKLKPGYQTTEFWTMLVMQIVAVLLAKGIITASVASAIDNQAALFGGILLSLLGGLVYIIGRNVQKVVQRVKLGPLPDFTVNDAPVATGPASPSYGGPASGGEVTPLPPHLAGVV